MSSSGGESDWLSGMELSFTGKLASLTRMEASALVLRCGGTVSDPLTEQTRYLVVGSLYWPLREDGRITRKLAQANSMREEGSSLLILTEEEFLERAGLKDHRAGRGTLFTIGQLSRILGVKARRIRAWMRHGLISPVETVHRLSYFDFRQVAGARSLIDLLHSGVSLLEIRQSLDQLSTWMPNVDLPLSQLSMLERNGHVLVRLEGGELVEASGQLHFDFIDQGPRVFENDGTYRGTSVVLEDREFVPSGEEEPEEPGSVPEDIGSAETEGKHLPKRLGPRGSVEGGEGQEDDAPVQRTLQLPSQDRGAEEWFEAALDYEDSGELEQAVHAYREGLLRGGPQPESCFNLANALYALNRKEQAYERYCQAVELDPDYVEAWNNLANVLTELGEWQDSIRAYRKALSIAPGYADAHYNLAETLDQLGLPREADRHYQAYLSLDPQSSWAELVRKRLMDAK